MTTAFNVTKVGGDDSKRESMPLPARDLTKALAARHNRLMGWNGEATPAQLSAAIRLASASYAHLVYGGSRPHHRNWLAEGLHPWRSQHLDNIDLLDAVADAISGKTKDGCALTLKGRQGKKLTSEDFDERLAIAAAVQTDIDAGHGFDSAIASATRRFSCSRTKVTDAYADLRRFLVYLMEVDDRSPDDALRVLAEARANP